MLDDAAFDVEAWLASEIASEFARATCRAASAPKPWKTACAWPDGRCAAGSLWIRRCGG